ncbi:FKBP-type peptidyl-prolyl cis-trans isomerase N-terminal domain-containing protein [Rahnella laticis]|uniref:FKBP-type peptidyl-prolyl cis-trans isomerase N-terminal domain-containing protein n=1 Tax=Rahnella laticis TaxID=2787622 RepID=UPI0018A2A002|nr:FKBP-type peptidyl-prolyl cis-trans isomerase N-terminal domain-containing protein [Rahnella laticis]MBF7996672.1 FKBP-type peptidyl-prolyl cis-trans isomerase [Rahnella laticis]
MFSLTRKKNACLAGLLMLSGAAVAADPAPVATPEPAVTSAPAVPAESVPAAPEKTAPVVPAESAPAAPEKPAPVASAEAAPAVPEKPAPVVPAESAPAAPEKPAPVVSAETAPAVPEKPAPVVTETPAPLTTLPTSAATVPAAKEEPKAPVKPAFSLDSEEQKRAYASGVAMARYIEEQIEQQKALHITMSKDIMLAGIADTFNNQVKMSDQDIHTTLTAFDEQVKVLTKAEMDKKSAADKAFLADFAKQDGVKKTKQGLLYLVKNKGEGNILKDTDMVEVSYQGKLVDGTIVDGPQVENANQIFRVANMPPVLRDSVKLIRKGGEIQVVIPPVAVENASDAKRPDVVVIYTITVVDVNKA